MPPKNPILLVQLPNAGLANKLLVWSHALVIANINGLNLKVYGWTNFHIGPFIRREKNKRIYIKFFKSDSIISILEYLIIILFKKTTKYSPLLKNYDKKVIYLYDEFPHWSEYFTFIRPFRTEIIRNFYALISPKNLAKIESFDGNCIGIHIRMGDFRKLNKNEDFRSVGAVRTPLNYFREIIFGLREISGKNLKALIFTDGFSEELSELTNIENIFIAESNNDIIDLVRLSKCKIIVASAGSTFSYWAIFISKSLAITHPQHPISIRDNNFYEGSLEKNNHLLIKYLKTFEN